MVTDLNFIIIGARSKASSVWKVNRIFAVLQLAVQRSEKIAKIGAILPGALVPGEKKAL